MLTCSSLGINIHPLVIHYTRQWEAPLTDLLQVSPSLPWVSCAASPSWVSNVSISLWTPASGVDETRFSAILNAEIF